MEIRLMQDNDVDSLYAMIKRTAEISYPTFYPSETVDLVLEQYTSKELLRAKMEKGKFYIALEEKRIVGCGCILFDTKENTSEITTVYVEPDYQGQGIGKEIMRVLESDATREKMNCIITYAALTAIPFYKRFGYEHMNRELNFISNNPHEGVFLMNKMLLEEKR
ncbi:MAG: GNAT family N-acetyltransferase [Oscillospiraceae bacterium]|nr:GNAT family N-acetyltransferase [Oscillospiraceae bacterium]